jgi:DNA-binding NarL/FixJ family response regulator
VSDYVLKGGGASELVDVVRAVNDGGSHVSPSLAAKLLSNFSALSRKGDYGQDPIR